MSLLDMHLPISNDIVSTQIYDKRDDFDFDIVDFPFLNEGIFRALHRIASISLNLPELLEHLAILLTSLFTINY